MMQGMDTDSISWSKPPKVVMQKKKAGFKEIYQFIHDNIDTLSKDDECVKISDDKNVILKGTQDNI
jgi:hypothetical protein